MLFLLLALVIFVVFVLVDVFWAGWVDWPVDGIWGTITALLLTLSILGAAQLVSYMVQGTYFGMKGMMITGGILWFIGDWLLRAPDYFGIKFRPHVRRETDDDIYDHI